MKAWLQAEAESRVERAQNFRTRTFLHWLSGTRVCYCRADVPSVGSLLTVRQGSTALLNKHKGAWLGPATVLAPEKGRSQEQHEEAHGTVWIVVQGRLMRCAPEHLRHLSERESLSLDRDKGVEERARTFTLYRISSSQRAHMLISEVNPILLKGQSRDISVVEFFFENANRNVWNEFEWSEYRDDTCD